MSRQTAIQFFSALAIIVGLAISYYPPDANAEAAWALVGGFLGYAVRDLFNGSGANPEATKQGGFARVWMLLAMACSAIVLSGCSLLPATYGQVEEKLAQAIVQSSERTICRDIPVGTWMRLYGTNPDRLRGWQGLCLNPSSAPVDKAATAEAINRAYDVVEPRK